MAYSYHDRTENKMEGNKMGHMKEYWEDMKALAPDCATDDQANISIIVNFGVHVGAEQIREWRENV